MAKAGKLASFVLGGFLATLISPVVAAQQPSRSDIVDAFSQGFDLCLAALRANDASGLGEQVDNPTTLAGVFPAQWYLVGDDVGVAIQLLYQRDRSAGTRSFFACQVVSVDGQGPLVRRDLLDWAQRMQAGFERLAGVDVRPATHDETYAVSVWCENGTQPFSASIGALRAGAPVMANVNSSAGITPNPCEQE